MIFLLRYSFRHIEIGRYIYVKINWRYVLYDGISAEREQVNWFEFYGRKMKMGTNRCVAMGVYVYLLFIYSLIWMFFGERGTSSPQQTFSYTHIDKILEPPYFFFKKINNDIYLQYRISRRPYEGPVTENHIITIQRKLQ